MTDKTDTSAATATPPIQLDVPIRREGQTITTVTLRRPRAGELRGLSMISVLQMEVDALAALVPRISTPTVHTPEVMQLDPADLLAIGMQVVGFFQSRAQQALAAAVPMASGTPTLN